MTAPWISINAEAVEHVSGSAVSLIANSRSRSRGGFRTNGGVEQSSLQPPRTSGCTGLYAQIDRTINTSSGSWLVWEDDAGNDVMRLRCNASSTQVFEYWNGAAWISLGSIDTPYGVDRRIVVDFAGVGTAAGELTCRVTNYNADASYETLVGTGLDLSSRGNISRMRFADGQSGSNNYVSYSEMFLADGSAASLFIYGFNTSNIVAGTDQTQASGTVTAVDEVSGSPDADWLSLSSSGQRFSAKAATAISYGIRTVQAVGFGARLRCGATGVNQVKAYLKISGTRYYWGGGTGTIITLGTDYKGHHFDWPLNPATGAAWTAAEAETLTTEYGIEVV